MRQPLKERIAAGFLRQLASKDTTILEYADDFGGSVAVADDVEEDVPLARDGGSPIPYGSNCVCEACGDWIDAELDEEEEAMNEAFRLKAPGRSRST